MNEQLATAVVGLGILAALGLGYYKKGYKFFAVLFVITLLVFAALDLFLSGSLGEFSIKGMTAEAKFVRQKREEVQRDAEQTKQLGQEIEGQAQSIRDLVTRLQKAESDTQSSKKNIETMEAEIRRTVEMARPQCLVESGSKVQKTPDGTAVVIQFRGDKHQAIGYAEFKVSVSEGVKILDVGALGPTVGDSKYEFSKDRRIAQVGIRPLGGDTTGIRFLLSEPSHVEIEGNLLPTPLEFDAQPR